MNILVFLESDGSVKKSSLEALAYAHKTAQALGGGAITAVIAGPTTTDLGSLGGYGVQKVLHADDSAFVQVDIMTSAAVLKQAIAISNPDLVVLAKSSLVDAMAPRVAAATGAALATNVVDLPVLNNGVLSVKRSIYTGKAFSDVALNATLRILTVKKGAATGFEPNSASTTVESLPVSLSAADKALTSKGTEKATGEILLPEADLVVSGGRGLKGPENWGLITDLAKTLGAATACSKPVSDLDWRPHHEHVGQTGIKVSPSLYIAAGISGAIQHVAGISSSKCIVAINSDPEAPIFKVADYGIVGDVFKILPALNQALK
jgi:electron transfer flavoprotein alpha subunit